MAGILGLNDTQSDILSVVYKLADDEDLLLCDTKDLKAILQFASENAAELETEYGHIAKQSVAAIVRAIVALEGEGADQFFGEPAINVADFFTTDPSGKGTINVLDSSSLINQPRLYSAFMLYLLSELFEVLPEVGDMDKPRVVFFFDEAHLLFDSASSELMEKIEQMIKLIRSKGVGVYFITQSPWDIPDAVASQLGNKIEHGLRAYTPAERKVLKAAACGAWPPPQRARWAASWAAFWAASSVRSAKSWAATWGPASAATCWARCSSAERRRGTSAT